jgi:Na+/melibiose symporter-like transporter
MRDAGHDGPHWVEGEIPPSIGKMIEGVMTAHEREAERLRRSRRWYTVFGVLWLVSFTANVVATTAGGSVTWLGGMLVGVVGGVISTVAAMLLGSWLRSRRDTLSSPPPEENL